MRKFKLIKSYFFGKLNKFCFHYLWIKKWKLRLIAHMDGNNDK